MANTKMTTYDLVVNIPHKKIVDLVKKARYKLCLGVFIQHDQKAFPSIAIDSIKCQYTQDVNR
jgi:hypothetical protein